VWGVVGVGAVAFLTAATAFADEPREGVQFELGVTGGVHIFSKTSELGVADDVMSTSLKLSPAFGLRIGVVPHPMFGIEVEGLGMPTKDKNFGQSVFALGYRGNLLYHIAPGQIAGGKVTPFVLVGAGAIQVVSADSNASEYSVRKDTDFEFHGGLGVKFAVTDVLQLRLDGRALGVPSTKKQSFTPDFEALGTVAFTFGGQKAAPPPPPPPLVKDSDGDGIDDNNDKCPTEAGTRANAGCPDKDSDGDGVIDRKDKCPDKAGPVERDGCPEEDKDNDGIGDSVDKCPEEAEDKDNFEDEDGCPDPDNDKDGVADAQDKCPTEPESKNGYQDEDGCPDEVPAPVKKFTGVVKGINFRRNSADIKPSSFPLLKEAVSVFRNFPELRVEISGHTSNEGKRDFNMKLSRKRAESVKGFLVSAGIDEKRIGTVGYGPDRPIAENDSKEGQEKNRRIEFRLLSASETTQVAPESGDIDPVPERKGKAKKSKKAEDAAAKPEKAEKPKSDKPAEEKPKPDKADKAADKPKGKAKGASKKEPDDEPPPSGKK
jgi:outer membrane protein OmpA-like peptidoglycan-associated protein